MKRCWCGNEALEEYSSAYCTCRRCHTLVSKSEFDNLIYHIDDEENDLYGRNYWEKTMMEEAGLSSVDEIIDLYLRERAVYWLEYLLKYLPLHGKVAEVGCGLGQLAYLMKQLEFRQRAYELSPDICRYVRRELGIDIVSTPFEEAKEQYDAVLSFDVVEHILEPQAFIANCVRHLEDEGVLCIQTPCYDEELSYDEMCGRKPRFRNLLVEDQHIYLYSKASMRELLKAAGVEYIQFLPAFFGDDYDMFLVASRKPLRVNSDREIEEFLNGTPNGRLVKAMLAMSRENRNLTARFQTAEQNSTARMEQVETLTALLKTSEADRAARYEQILELTKLIKESEAGRAAEREQIEVLTKQLTESEADRAAGREQIGLLTRQLKKEKHIAHRNWNRK